MTSGRIAGLTLLFGFGAALASACAASSEGGDGGAEPTSTSSAGGNGGTATGSQGGSGGGVGGTGGDPSPCPTDCSAIQTDQCQEAICNEDTLACEVIALDDGTMCEDGLFCTVNDVCTNGVCTGGPQNDCGMAPPECTSILCDEVSQTCTTEAADQGAACQPADLCLVNASCSNGQCVGGVIKDCFFEPVPNECFNSVCNPMNGVCEPVAGNDGSNCTDTNDLCSVGNTCAAGVCSGGSPLDCSGLTMGCFDGQCDVATGQCIQVPIMPGNQCAEATDECNTGICDMNGMCNPMPTNNGGNCDTDGCFVGQTCSNGTCQGGAETTACVNNDNCCPATCSIANDDDCGCDFALISNESQLADATITGLLTTAGHTFVNYNNNNSGVHTSDINLLNMYETIILHEHDRVISATEMNNLMNWVNAGGSLLVTGYDSLRSPTDTNMATVLNCSGPTDGPFTSQLSVVNSTHPIMQGPAQAFMMGTNLTAASTDHDTCTLGAGAISLVSISGASKLFVTDNVGAGNGKVIYWNGNGTTTGDLLDWTGGGGTQPDLQNLFVNVLDHMCQ